MGRAGPHDSTRHALVTRFALVVTAAVCVLAVSGADARSGAGPKRDQRDVLVVGHRGASGSRPER